MTEEGSLQSYIDETVKVLRRDRLVRADSVGRVEVATSSSQLAEAINSAIMANSIRGRDMNDLRAIKETVLAMRF